MNEELKEKERKSKKSDTYVHVALSIYYCDKLYLSSVCKQSTLPQD